MSPEIIAERKAEIEERRLARLRQIELSNKAIEIKKTFKPISRWAINKSTPVSEFKAKPKKWKHSGPIKKSNKASVKKLHGNATDRQKNYMRSLGITFQKTISKKAASGLIQEKVNSERTTTKATKEQFEILDKIGIYAKKEISSYLASAIIMAYMKESVLNE